MSDLPEADRLDALPAPRETPWLLGQETAEQAFLDAFMNGRLHHAWLLTGPKGIGKATLAYRMARFLLRYPEPGNNISPVPSGKKLLDMDPSDPVFRQVSSLGHPGLLVIRRPTDDKTKRLKASIPVEEIRRTAGFFGKSSGAGGWRICLVDSADEMNTSSANALLKVLEEPPRRSLFILVSHRPGGLLPTLRSRCRTLALDPLTPPLIHDLLSRANPGLSKTEADNITTLSDGSGGRALAIATGNGLELYQAMMGVLDGLPHLNTDTLHALAHKAGARSKEASFDMLMSLMEDWLSRLIRAQAGSLAQDRLLEPEQALLVKLAKTVSLDRWVKVWEKTAQSARQAETLNLDRKLLILNSFCHIEETCRAGPSSL